jgi:hypothetical protein
MPTPDRPRPDIRSGNGSPPGPARDDVRHATAYTVVDLTRRIHRDFAYDPAGTLHVTVAWGRDDGDVSPVKGVCVGGGSHGIEVAVHVSRIA